MPSPIHVEFTSYVVTEILLQLQTAAREDDRVAVIVDEINMAGSSKIDLSDGPQEPESKSKSKSPDGSFRYHHSRYPSAVIETSNSQNMKDLAELADEYIVETESDIQVVIGLDIYEGSKSKRATIFVWRPQIVPDPLYGS